MFPGQCLPELAVETKIFPEKKKPFAGNEESGV
jgi:hypothetical protein